MEIKAKLETRKFKNGDLEVLILKLSDNVEKLVFLTSAERDVLCRNYVSDDDDFPDLR